MKNTEIIKGLDVAISGLQTIKAAIEAENSGSNSDKASVSAPVATKPAIGKKAPAASVPATKPTIGGKKSPAPATADTGSQTYTVAELEGMKYNEFKKLAASLGVSCTGTRADIMERVIGTGAVSDAEGGAKSTPATTTKPAPATKGGLSAGGKKLGAKTPAKPAKDEFDEQAENIAKETPVKDVIAALASVGVKATKADAVTKLAQALRDGLLSLDDEEGEAGSEAESEAENGEEEGIDANSYFADYDPEGYNDPDNMTEARSEAVVEKMDAVLTEVSEGTLTQDMMIEFLQTVCTQDELDLLGDDYTEDDIVALYMEMTKRMIDNDGEEHEPGEPYELGEENMCCGHPLSYDESNGVFICDRCTGEYTAQ